MTKPTGKSGKGRTQRKKPNNGNATMKKYFPTTEKKPAQTANNSGNTTNDTSSVASNGSNHSNRSNTSSGSNSSYLGAIKNTNSMVPTNLEEKSAGTLEKTTADDENWTTVSNKSPPRNTDKRNRKSTPARQAKTDTTTTKATKKAGSPMTDKDSSPKCPNNPNVVTEEKPENPKPKSFPTVGKKPEDAPKENPNPVASPPKLGRNPQQPDTEATLEPKTNPPTNTGNGNKGKMVPEATPTLANTTSGNTGEPDKASAPTANNGQGKPNSGKDKDKTTTNQSPNNDSKGKANKKNKNKNKNNKKQVEFKVEPYTINTKAPATRSYMTLLDKIGNSKPSTEEELQSNILSVIQTFFTEEDNVKILFPMDIKDMDQATLEEFLKEAMR